MPSTPSAGQYSRFRCPHQACPLFNQSDRGNIGHRSWTGKHKAIERLVCRACGHEFSERTGTLMSHTKVGEATVERLLKCQRWGVCDTGTAEICDVDIKTVHRFQRLAAVRAQAHHQQVVDDLDVAGVQLDEAYSKRRPGKVEWIHTALAMESLFIVWVTFGPRTIKTAAYLLAQVLARVRGLPVILTDGWKAYRAALLQVVGQVYRPRRKGPVGRQPKPRLVAPSSLFYAQVVKRRDRAGRLLEVSQRVVFGGPRRFFKVLKQRALGTTIQTAFMERWYGTLRGLVAPLRRRTRCLSWSRRRHHGRIWLIVSLYNWVLPHKSLQRGRQPRTPAMALGLSEHVWTYRDYIWHPVFIDPGQAQQIKQRLRALLIPALPNEAKKTKTLKKRAKRATKKRKQTLKDAA